MFNCKILIKKSFLNSKRRLRSNDLERKNTIQKYIEKQTRNILKSIEGLMTATTGGASSNDGANRGARRQPLDINENFIFVNRCFNKSAPNLTADTINEDIAPISSLNLDAKCASNIGVYPKPTRSSNADNNVFNVRMNSNVNEQTIANGSLYY